MIKMVIFDIDGVLADTEEIHKEALSQAIHRVLGLNDWEIEPFVRIDGRSTKQKLESLQQKYSLTDQQINSIDCDKQEFTIDGVLTLKPSRDLIEFLTTLSRDYILVAATNSRRDNAHLVLNRLQIRSLFDSIITRDDVTEPKPSSEMIRTAMNRYCVWPSEVLVVEDSPTGVSAALAAGPHLFVPPMPLDPANFIAINEFLDDLSKNVKPVVVVPMAGEGSRFRDFGYSEVPKPIIPIEGRPMFEHVVEKIEFDADWLFVIQDKHAYETNIEEQILRVKPNAHIHKVMGLMNGTAITVDCARNWISQDRPVIIMNSDNIIEWDSTGVYQNFIDNEYDGFILTFESDNPAYSFVKHDYDIAVQVAEKKPISNSATAGVYGWRTGRDFLEDLDTMIEENDRVNGEFYVCPIYTQTIRQGGKVRCYGVDAFHSVGTPADLERYTWRDKVD